MLKFGVRWALVLIGIVLCASLFSAAAYSKTHQSATFYLLPFRVWELLIGALAAFYHNSGVRTHRRYVGDIGSLVGLLLITLSIFILDSETPFPGRYALLPTIGALLVILYANQSTFVGKILGGRLLVGIGLISYSAYLWHQPLFAFARHAYIAHPPIYVMLLLSILVIGLAYISWKYVEAPFRNRSHFKGNAIWKFSAAGSIALIALGSVGASQTNGFSSRFDISVLPQPWSHIKCHGAQRIADYSNPLESCLGEAKNGRQGDFFLVGDSHAAQLTFPLSKIASSRNATFGFINTEDTSDFPMSFWLKEVFDDRIFTHLLRVSDPGDFLFVAFHRGYLNDSRNQHIALDEAVEWNLKADRFYDNMMRQRDMLRRAGLTVFLILDSPLLGDSHSLERCAHINRKHGENPCIVSFDQDRYTRKRQEMAFEKLAVDAPEVFRVLDILPPLYAGREYFNPISENGDYKMFDRHHLTAETAISLAPYFENSL